MAKNNGLLFSVLIPSWNNLDYLKLCIKSIRLNSQYEHEIIIHINEGIDGTLEWVKSEGLAYTHSLENVGVCHALNRAAKLASTNYIAFLNDDMYLCPNWDKYMWNEISALGQDAFFISGTMIEPGESGNNCALSPFDFGTNVKNFQETKLLEEFELLEKSNWSGATWPPNVVSKKYWERVGGYSAEFSPGMSSDPDFSMKLWEAGVRYFIGLGKCKAYHFQAKSTGKVVKNNGNKTFLQKWGITQSTFLKYYLKRGEGFVGALPEPGNQPGLLLARLKSKIKLIFA